MEVGMIGIKILSQKLANLSQDMEKLKRALRSILLENWKVSIITPSTWPLFLCVPLPPVSLVVCWESSGAASGIYLYRLRMAGFVGTKKMILLK